MRSDLQPFLSLGTQFSVSWGVEGGGINTEYVEGDGMNTEKAEVDGMRTE